MFGTNFTYDLLVGQFAEETILTLGVEQAYDAIEEGLRIHAQQTGEVFSLFADVRTETVPGKDRYDVYGGNRILYGRKVDQVGRVDVQKVSGGYTVGFPLERTQFGIQWTEDFLEYATAADLAKDMDASRQGDVITMRNDLLQNIFNPANRTEKEMFYDNIDVDVKALINADGTEMPIGPNGEEFDGSTHTHYLGSATLTQAAVLTAIETVREHYGRGTVYVYTNQAHEDAYKGFVDFLPYTPTYLVPAPGGTSDRGRGTAEDMPVDDRAIGVLKGAIVWIKPWMPANYHFVHIVGPSINKIARFRQRKQGLYLAVKDKSFPLVADAMQHDYGVGVLERTAGAILRSNNATYAPPTFGA